MAETKTVDMEMCTLGAMILMPERIGRVVAVLTADDFLRPCDKLIFKALMDMDRDRTEVDIITLKNLLVVREELEQAGGVEYLADLISCVPSDAPIVEYAKCVRAYSDLACNGGPNIAAPAPRSCSIQEAEADDSSVLF